MFLVLHRMGSSYNCCRAEFVLKVAIPKTFKPPNWTFSLHWLAILVSYLDGNNSELCWLTFNMFVHYECENYRFILSCVQLSFIMGKSLINPLIYSIRIPEVDAQIRRFSKNLPLPKVHLFSSSIGNYEHNPTFSFPKQKGQNTTAYYRWQLCQERRKGTTKFRRTDVFPRNTLL